MVETRIDAKSGPLAWAGHSLVKYVIGQMFAVVLGWVFGRFRMKGHEVELIDGDTS
jgi:hypothetical protein